MTEDQTKKPPRSRIPWVRLSITYINDPKLKMARARAVFPWALTVLKRFDNRAPKEELHHEIAAIDLDLSEVETGRQMAGLIRVGLLNEDEDGFYSTPNWHKYQQDPRRNRRAKASKQSGSPANLVNDPGSRTNLAGDPVNTDSDAGDPGSSTKLVNDPGSPPQVVARSDLHVDPPMSTVDRHCSSQASSLRSPNQKGASPASPSPWGWRQIWTNEGRIRWEVGSIEEAFKKLWPGERMSRQIMGFAKELSVTAADVLDRAFELVSPECQPAGDEWARPYSMKRAVAKVQDSAPPVTAEQMDAEARQANMGRLLAGDASARRDRETYAEEFLNAGERPDGPVLEAIRMSFAERELAIPELFA